MAHPAFADSPDALAEELALEYRRVWVLELAGSTFVAATDIECENNGRFVPGASVAYVVREDNGLVFDATVEYDLRRWRENEHRAILREAHSAFGSDVDRERYHEAQDEICAEAGR